MPLFDYKCEVCGHVQEELVASIIDCSEHIIDCNICGGLTNRMVAGSVGIRLKGSGFYVNDYGSGKK
jgi:putative FmdB family regulatory protein